MRGRTVKLIATAALAALLALGSIGLASAAPASGATTILGPTGGPYDSEAHANTPTDVDVSISGGQPVVPYEYAIENRCWFSGKTSGPSDSYERFDLFGPWVVGADGLPHTTVTVNNNPVPVGANCKVAIVHNNTTVKGSTTSYPIVGP
jgi:hypothetical protein